MCRCLSVRVVEGNHGRRIPVAGDAGRMAGLVGGRPDRDLRADSAVRPAPVIQDIEAAAGARPPGGLGRSARPDGGLPPGGRVQLHRAGPQPAFTWRSAFHGCSRCSGASSRCCRTAAIRFTAGPPCWSNWSSRRCRSPMLSASSRDPPGAARAAPNGVRQKCRNACGATCCGLRERVLDGIRLSAGVADRATTRPENIPCCQRLGQRLRWRREVRGQPD